MYFGHFDILKVFWLFWMFRDYSDHFKGFWVILVFSEYFDHFLYFQEYFGYFDGSGVFFFLIMVRVLFGDFEVILVIL